MPSGPAGPLDEDSSDVQQSGPFGLVVILDALGTRGRWSREKPADAAVKIHEQMRLGKKLPPSVTFNPDGAEFELSEDEEPDGDRPESLRWNLRSFYLSDTLVLTVRLSALNEELIDLFGAYLARMYARALQGGVLFRGAISTGEWASKGSVLVGPCVDEAAEWYEKADWAGVMLSPSAWGAFDHASKREGFIPASLCRYDIPLHGGRAFRGGWALKWPSYFKGTRFDVEQLLLKAPVHEDVAFKAINTLRFFDEFQGKKAGDFP
jgi:hypothetical protein